MAKSETTQAKLLRLGACEEAIEWVKDRSPQKAWDECNKPGWMFWLLQHTMREKSNA